MVCEKRLGGWHLLAGCDDVVLVHPEVVERLLGLVDRVLVPEVQHLDQLAHRPAALGLSGGTKVMMQPCLIDQRLVS